MHKYQIVEPIRTYPKTSIKDELNRKLNWTSDTWPYKNRTQPGMFAKTTTKSYALTEQEKHNRTHALQSVDEHKTTTPDPTMYKEKGGRFYPI